VTDSWVLGVHIPDTDFWEDVKSGVFNGFSFEGAIIRTDVEVEVEVPEYVAGVTSSDAGHKHTFKAHFNDSGEFIGGETNIVDGHMHVIRLGTVTEYSENSTNEKHRHTFEVLETGALKVVG
jgi:hypothetical protein